MNIRKARFLLIVFSLLITSNSSFGMEERPSGLTLISGILLGWYSPSVLWTQPETSETFTLFTDLPKEIQDYVFQLLIAGATGGTLAESAGAIHSLSQVNKEWNAFFSDMKFSCDLVKSFAQRFNCSEETVCLALSTKAAKEYLQANENLLQKFSQHTIQQYPQNISCDLPNDVNFRVNSLGSYALSPHTPYNSTDYPVFVPLFPGGGNLIMYLYSNSSTSYIDTIIEQQCSINIDSVNNDGKTVLMFATYNPWHRADEKNVVAHALSRFPNININKQDNNGNTALLHALQATLTIEGQSESRFIGKIPVTFPLTPDINNIKILLEHDADPKLANFDGLTPLEAALNTENDEIIQLIQEAVQESYYRQFGSASSSASQD